MGTNAWRLQVGKAAGVFIEWAVTGSSSSSTELFVNSGVTVMLARWLQVDGGAFIIMFLLGAGRCLHAWLLPSALCRIIYIMLSNAREIQTIYLHLR